jgi:hypothetical protein
MISTFQLKILYIHKDSEFLKDINLEYELNIVKISSDMISEYGGVIGIKFY